MSLSKGSKDFVATHSLLVEGSNTKWLLGIDFPHDIQSVSDGEVFHSQDVNYFTFVPEEGRWFIEELNPKLENE